MVTFNDTPYNIDRLASLFAFEPLCARSWLRGEAQDVPNSTNPLNIAAGGYTADMQTGRLGAFAKFETPTIGLYAARYLVYGLSPSYGYDAIVAMAGSRDPYAQARTIENSRWAAGHYGSTLDAPGTLARAVAAALPRKSDMGYTPIFVTQTDEPPPWYDCAWAAASMLLDKWTLGGLRVDKDVLRAKSGDTYRGSGLDDVARAFRAYGYALPHYESGLRLTLDGLLRRLADGHGAILGGLYSALPSWLSRWSPSFASSGDSRHMIYVERFDGTRAWWMDPLGRADYAGEWVSIASLKAYSAGMARSGYLYVATTPPSYRDGNDPMITAPGYFDPAERRPLKGLRLRDGTPLHRSPNGTIATRMSADATVPAFGLADGSTAWRAILVRTGAVYADGLTRDTVLYVRGADVLGMEDLPIPKPDCTAAVQEAVKPLQERLDSLATDLQGVQALVADLSNRIDAALAELGG